MEWVSITWTRPNGVILSKDLAEKYFGDENPVGENKS